MRTFIFIAFLLVSMASYAQAMVCNCNFGIKAGANFSSITDASGLSNRTGFTAGFFGGARLGSAVGIHGDLLYSQQGAEIGSEKIELSYINVPVVLKYYVVGGLNIQAGPQFGFLIDDNVSEVLGNVVEAESFDLTGVAGVGYDISRRFKVDARYHFGVTDIFSNTEGRNSVISIAFGYSFL